MHESLGEFTRELAAIDTGEVFRVADGRISVRIGTGDLILDCLPLEAASSLVYSIGDKVLLWRSEARDLAVVIGRYERATANEASDDGAAEVGCAVPDTLVLEARHSLTLRVGDGEITIREDGKILIKGKDLVSHAQRMNRIKGGAVSIN